MAKCLYEILEISIEAQPEEIRKSFLKLALKYHPDKCSNSEEAVNNFRTIRNAYDILSDKKERQWYDDHRLEVLGATNSEEEQEYIINLYKYFSVSCYENFDDTEKGFYTIYREVFNQVSLKEVQYTKSSNNAPSFGTSSTSYTEILFFYQYWLSFVTSIPFTWCDEHRIPDAPNRQIRRLMEKENKKLRDFARKKYITEVRTLVEFVRKRDPRVLEEIKRISLEKEQKKQAELEEKEIRQIKHQDEKRKFKEKREQVWLEEEYNRDEEPLRLADAFVDEEIEKRTRKLEQKVLKCVVCSKSFKSDKQLCNHLQSKKHRERLNLVGRNFEEEEEDVVVVKSKEDEERLIEELEHQNDSFVNQFSICLNEELEAD